MAVTIMLFHRHTVTAIDLLNETLTGTPTIQKKKGHRMVKSRNPQIFMVGPGGFEPPTSTVSRYINTKLRSEVLQIDSFLGHKGI
jgi:hypothetical protein